MSTAPSRVEILFIIGALDVGGTERHLAMIAPLLVRQGWHVSVYSLAGNGALRDEFERGQVTVIVPPFERDKGGRLLVARVGRLMVSAVHLLSVILRRKPMIVHFFLPSAYLVGSPLAKIACVPKLVMSRRSLNLYQRRYPVVRVVERFLHHRMTAILANSHRVLRELRDEEGAPSDRLALIYNGIDMKAYADVPGHTTRTELGLMSSAFVMIIVANLIPYKGHDDLLRALSTIRAELPQGWRLLIVGRDDGIGAQLREQAKAFLIEENVKFLGVRNDVAAILAASDVGIICSHEEGFSNSVLEGMASSLPMIVTDVGGNPEAVLNEECGLVVPPKDSPALGRAILRLAKDRDLRTRLGAAARQRVAGQFTLERCVADYDAFYRALIKNCRVPAEVQVSDGA